MAGDLKKYGMFLALVLPACALADDLPDPTRPPAAIMTPSAEGGSPAEEASSGLQSIIISKKRRAAIIDGETVELGGKHGDARLIEVTEGSVVLTGPQGRQVLRLFPGVRMVRKKELDVKPQHAASNARARKAAGKPASHKEKK